MENYSDAGTELRDQGMTHFGDRLNARSCTARGAARSSCIPEPLWALSLPAGGSDHLVELYRCSGCNIRSLRGIKERTSTFHGRDLNYCRYTCAPLEATLDTAPLVRERRYRQRYWSIERQATIHF